MIDYNVIRENFDLLKPLIGARKRVNDIRNELNFVGSVKPLISQALTDGFNENIRQIEIRILQICDINSYNEDQVFDILSAYRSVCFIDKIKED